MNETVNKIIKDIVKQQEEYYLKEASRICTFLLGDTVEIKTESDAIKYKQLLADIGWGLRIESETPNIEPLTLGGRYWEESYTFNQVSRVVPYRLES